MSDDLERLAIDDAERVFQTGYRAAALKDCPYPEAPQGPYVLWMQGWHRHQADRAAVAVAAAEPWCRHPLRSPFDA